MVQNLTEAVLKKTIVFIGQKRELEKKDTERDLTESTRKKTLEYIGRIRLLRKGKRVTTKVEPWGTTKCQP